MPLRPLSTLRLVGTSSASSLGDGRDPDKRAGAAARVGPRARTGRMAAMSRRRAVVVRRVSPHIAARWLLSAIRPAGVLRERESPMARTDVTVLGAGIVGTSAA